MQIPENGFYYHYKHNPSKGINDHSYEVMGIARHSEQDENFVIYRPLYQITDIAPATQFARPIELFFEEVEYEGKTFPRFVKITDPEIIANLLEIRSQMYKN